MGGRYINWNEVAGRYPDAAKKAGDGSMGSYWLGTAEDEIDGYLLASRYTVPFTPAPGPVRDLCIDLTYYKMIIQQEGADKVWAYIDYRIKSILNGTLVLTSSGAALPQGTASWSQAAGHHTAFGPDSVLNWQPSSAWMEQVQSERELG